MVNLTPYDKQRKEELQEKLRTRVLTINEGNELRVILEKEKSIATSSGDWATALGIIILLGLLIAFLRDR